MKSVPDTDRNPSVLSTQPNSRLVVIHRHIFPHIGDRFLPGSVPTITGPFSQAAEESLHRRIVLPLRLILQIMPCCFSNFW